MEIAFQDVGNLLGLRGDIVVGSALGDEHAQGVELIDDLVVPGGVGGGQVALPDGTEFVDQGLPLLRELGRLAVFQRDDDAALVNAVAVFLRDEFDEACQEPLQAGGVLLGEQVGQCALHVLPPQGDRGLGVGRIERLG